MGLLVIREVRQVMTSAAPLVAPPLAWRAEETGARLAAALADVWGWRDG